MKQWVSATICTRVRVETFSKATTGWLGKLKFPADVTREKPRDFTARCVTEIVSGGAKGVDECAAKYAKNNCIKLTTFLPEYNKYRKFAPLKRNLQIIDYCDCILAFWDGKSKGTKYVIDTCHKTDKKISVIIIALENT